MSESIELTKFNGERLTVFKRWVTSIHELPAYHPVPRICCTIFIGTANEGINVQETYDEVIEALNSNSSYQEKPARATAPQIKAVLNN